MKKLIYVVDYKKNFLKCQKKQHFYNLPCEIHCFDRFFSGLFISAWGSIASLGCRVPMRQLQKRASAKIKICTK